MRAEERTDGVRIEGAGGLIGDANADLPACVVDSRGDHRIAMSFAIASLAARVPIKILDCANIATSFPGFIGICERLGMQIGR